MLRTSGRRGGTLSCTIPWLRCVSRPSWPSRSSYCSWLTLIDRQAWLYTVNDVSTNSTMLAFERIRFFFVKTSKLDRKIFYRFEIRTVEVQCYDVVGYYQPLETRSRLMISCNLTWHFYLCRILPTCRLLTETENAAGWGTHIPTMLSSWVLHLLTNACRTTSGSIKVALGLPTFFTQTVLSTQCSVSQPEKTKQHAIQSRFCSRLCHSRSCRCPSPCRHRHRSPRLWESSSHYQR